MEISKYKIIFTLVRKVIFSFFLGSFALLFAEGTKELRPTEASFGSINLMDTKNGLNKERTFALYTATDETRLNIRISDFNNEIIYMGFSTFKDDDLYFRIKDPNGNVVFGEMLVPQDNGDPGKIVDYDEAVFGPNILGADGYMPLTFQPTMAGDYSIEFNDTDYEPNINDDDGVYPKRKIELFDITVYNQASLEVKPGRLWSNAWDLTTDTRSGDKDFDGSVFILTTDGITTKADFNDFKPFSFIIQSNSTGPTNTGNLEADRQSTTQGILLPEYRIFLNEPDKDEFPPSIVPTINSVPQFDLCNLSTDQCIEIEVSNPGVINYIIDLAGGPGFDDPRDLELIAFLGMVWMVMGIL